MVGFVSMIAEDYSSGKDWLSSLSGLHLQSSPSTVFYFPPYHVLLGFSDLSPYQS